jgi:hypothetical protein
VGREDEARRVIAARAQTLAASLWYSSAGTRSAAAEHPGFGSPNDSPVSPSLHALWSSSLVQGSGLVFQRLA